MIVSVRARVNIPLHNDVVSEFITFNGFPNHQDHFAVSFNRHKLNPAEPPLVRIHSECITGDLFGSQRCDCGEQLNEARNYFREHGGYLLYLRQEGRGIGLKHKMDAYLLQEAGLNTFEANVRLNLPEDGRDFKCAAQMLLALNVPVVRLLTNNKRKAQEIAEHGISVHATIPTGCYVNEYNKNYLRAKQTLDGHALGLN